MPEPQSFQNHARTVPAYHYFVLPMMLVYLIWSVYGAVTDFSVGAVLTALFVLAVALTALFARVFALKAQDRIIRLEERLRMERLLNGELAARAAALEVEQLIGLRFASDHELESLVRQVLDEGVTDRKSIKERVGEWRADHVRV